MAERRPLIEGLKTPPVDPQREKDFVYGPGGSSASGKSSVIPATAVSPAAPNLNRVPISTRIRGDFAATLRRASLERQLNSVEPNTLQDILEEALEPWLKSKGYIQ